MANVIVVTSGKGGVGKSTISSIIATSLSEQFKVLIIDADIGLKNLENILQVKKNRNDITDVLMGRCFLDEAITNVSKNLYLLSLCQSSNVKNFNVNLLSDCIEMIENYYDYIIIDSPAGIENGFHSAIKKAKKAIVVLNDEPNSYSDGRKVTNLLKSNKIRNIYYIVNKFDKSEMNKKKIKDFIASIFFSTNVYFFPRFDQKQKENIPFICKSSYVKKIRYEITKFNM